MRVSQIFLKLTDKTIQDYPNYLIGQKRFKQLGKPYLLYDDKKADALMKKYPEFYEMWKSVPYAIMKVDILRFIILYHYGGLVSDLDVVPVVTSLAPFENLTKDSILLFTPKIINYEVICATKHNEYFLDFLRYVKEQIIKKSKIKVYKVWKGRFVLNTTGPYSFKRFMKENPNPNLKMVEMNRFIDEKSIQDTINGLKKGKFPFITLQQSGWLESIGSKEIYDKDRDALIKLLVGK
jgi:hypothetical protein